MSRYMKRLAVIVVLTLGVCVVALAQAPAPAQAPKPEVSAPEAPARAPEPVGIVPLSIEVVLSRYQGEKKISSYPYILAVNANEPGGGGQSQLRMGANVPVPSLLMPKAASGTAPAGPFQYQYQDIGTSIDCSARTVAGGIQVRLSVEDKSVYANAPDAATPTIGDAPVFRTFRSTNTLVLRDGQTREFTAATDRVNGEVVRVSVTMRIVK